MQQSNDKGTWFGWDVARVGPITDANVYATAKDFSNAVARGNVEVKQGDREKESKSPY